MFIFWLLGDVDIWDGYIYIFNIVEYRKSHQFRQDNPTDLLIL